MLGATCDANPQGSVFDWFLVLHWFRVSFRYSHIETKEAS
jgi:hypothetical protein